MTYSVGSLVRARGREWVVLPGSAGPVVMVRPLGGGELEETAIHGGLESIEPARFAPPDPALHGDHHSASLLREALRLGFRSSAGPFRSFAHLAVDPRPYQLVPLLMALKLDPVRMLIADDVGIGKTIEAALVARELLDRGDARRLAVLCPPHLAEQWQLELSDKFHLDCELVLPGTAARLERQCRVGQSLFDVFERVIVSLDFIKSDQRRHEFLRTCPDLVIVDEAHTCTAGADGRKSRQQRQQLIAGLAADPARHLLLVTATPHSGKEDAFRTMLSWLSADFSELPDDLTGAGNEAHRRRVAAHMVQRRRADIRKYLQTDTPFPYREDLLPEPTYRLSPAYRAFFERILRYARESVLDEKSGAFHQRIRWWSALALLRSIASSPAAAAETLRNRNPASEASTLDEADELGRRAVMDLAEDEPETGSDVAPGAVSGEETAPETSTERRRLLELAREAEGLCGAKDEKLLGAVKLLHQLLDEGFSPIVFCRYIPTARYLESELGQRLKGVTVRAVTGELPPEGRLERIHELAEAPRRILVATDCLSEGINLQEWFDAVFHYDLSWNPTRHEQRDGRVDRFNGRPRVRVVTYYGMDNRIDGLVLDVLLRKHRAIRGMLGVSVPVPVNTEQVMEAILEGVLLRQGRDRDELQPSLPEMEELLAPKKQAVHQAWESAAEREKRSRTVFAQETIKVEEVAQELAAVHGAIGSGVDVEWFTCRAFQMLGAGVTRRDKAVEVHLTGVPLALKEAVGGVERLRGRFELPVNPGELHLSRTHPVVEALATHVLDTALDPQSKAIARRSGVIRTSQVSKRTTLLLLRARYHLVTRRGDEERPQLAEDCLLAAFAGSPQAPEWLDPAAAEKLLAAQPEGNIGPDQATDALRKILDGFDLLLPQLEALAVRHGSEVLEAHQRVRRAAALKGVTHRVEPQLPPDVLGVYVYLPRVG